jgi:hypothetical protein
LERKCVDRIHSHLTVQYPVITANTVNRESLLYSNPSLVTPATNRNLIQPTKINKKRRKQQIKDIQESANKGKERSESESNAKPLLQKTASASSSSSNNSRNSQLVDLIVRDEDAEAMERVRARKEGSPRWNETEPRHYV